MTDLPVFLTVDEVAAHLRIHRSTVYAMMARGTIPYKQYGTRRVVPRCWLEEQVAEALQPEVIDLTAVRRRKKR